MPVAWRPLLDSVRQPWRDRGSNTSSGNVNICCPWCRDDNGFHLSISEEKDAYYCYRSPRQHSGGNMIWLMTAIGINRDEANRLLNRFRGIAASAPPKVLAIKGDVATAWHRMDRAGDSPAHLEYMQSRGFADAKRVCDQFDLRYAPAGTWAMRVLLPVLRHGVVTTWSGRAIRPTLTPKYLAEADADSGKSMLYAPGAPAYGWEGARAVIVEGQLDALKIAAAGVPDVGAIALVGKALGPSKLLHLRETLMQVRCVDVALDADAGLTDALGTMTALRGAGITVPIRRKPMPDGFKDAGEMSYEEVKEWIVTK